MKHAGTQLLETKRLVLRKYDSSDADDMYRNWVTDPEVCRFWQWEPHRNIGETKTLLRGWIQEYGKPDYYHWTIELKSASQAIGYIYFSDVDDTDNSLSVHYALSRKYWGMGIMTEACRCVLDFAFTVLGAERIFSYHHADVYKRQPLRELGEYLDPPVGKSGVNHRLRKLGELADKVRSRQGINS